MSCTEHLPEGALAHASIAGLKRATLAHRVRRRSDGE